MIANKHTISVGSNDEVRTLAYGLGSAHHLRSSTVGALLILTILLGKAIVCFREPSRAVFFDVLLLIPISLLAYHQGLVTGLVAGVVASAADVVIGARNHGMLIPDYLSVGAIRSILVTRLFTQEVVAAIVAGLSMRARREALEAQQKADEYFQKIRLLKKQNAAIELDTRHKEAEFEKKLLKYSSLPYLLEESAQKIYSNLDVDHLFQSFFRVLQECFGSTCASVYLRNGRKDVFLLARTFGADEPLKGEGGSHSAHIPMMLRADDLVPATLQRTRGAVCWANETYAGQLKAAGQPVPAVLSGALLDKGEVIGIVNIHATNQRPQPDVMLMGMVCNIASIALANARLFGEVQWLAERDPLTKLYNRRTFHAQLDAQVAARSASGESFALLMLDIDHFKALNDTYGHHAGDAALEWFAARCAEIAGEHSPVFRYGGEEFAVLVPQANVAQGAVLAERIRKHIADSAYVYDGTELKVLVSCGVAAYPENASTVDELVHKADRALYRAKEAGRNTVAVCDAPPGHDSTIVPYVVQVAAEDHS